MSERPVEPTNVVEAESPAPTTSKEIQHLDKSNSLATSNYLNGAINHLNLFDDKDLVAAENFLTKIMRSEKGGIKTVNDGLAVLMRCQDLNLPFSSCLEHIHVINGKTGVDIHIVKALLSKAACTWRCINDYQAQYEYTDGINVYCDGQLPSYTIKCISKQEAEAKRQEDKDGDNVYIWPVKWYSDFNGNKYKDYQLNTKTHKIITTRQEAVALMQQKIIGVYRVPAMPIDYITTYEITRKVDGKEVHAIGHFSYTEAVAAEMLDKDTYKKYPRIMIAHRAFMYAARDIASDVLLGAYCTTELKQINNIDIVDSDYTEI